MTSCDMREHCTCPPVEILPHFLINHSECGCIVSGFEHSMHTDWL